VTKIRLIAPCSVSESRARRCAPLPGPAVWGPRKDLEHRKCAALDAPNAPIEGATAPGPGLRAGRSPVGWIQ